MTVALKAETDSGTAQRLQLPNDRAEFNCGADPPEGHAGDPDDLSGARCLNAGALG